MARAQRTGAERLHGLPDAERRQVEFATRLIADRRFDEAERTLAGVLATTADHPEALRLIAAARINLNRHAAALDALRRAIAQWPDDARLHHDLGHALQRIGRTEEALAAWRHAAALAPDFFAAWLDLGTLLQAAGSTGQAREALRRAVALVPGHAMAHVKLGDASMFLGSIDEAAHEYREALRANPRCGPAWWGLAGMKTHGFDDGEFERLRRIHDTLDANDPDRVAMGFALGRALEDRRRYAEAFAALTEANAAMRRRIAWDAADFEARIENLLTVFDAPQASADSTSLGREVIFIVGLPRSGSTLTEQILAAHHEVEGASELTDLGAVIGEESNRRRVPFPHWVADALPEDWERMGRRYLERTARWRSERPRFTDKMPNNWLFLGAALAMLPGARVVDCRRDPVETCWSCFKHLFSQGAVFSYDLADTAVYWRAYDRTMKHWKRLYPGRIRDQVYESLIADPEGEIRRLLEFCGLPFDADCLEFHRVRRDVRTASAAQVREPLRGDTARTAGYGDLLDPLRARLAGDRDR